ncbi:MULTISPECIES: hypothetical protein [Microbacterium]|uniref:hypothetical protein n=1 Tax=Microbacterium TaxID=33882 RepID=UPI000D65C7BA|nr:MULTISPECIES: hypothetical protein [Microbacterium]
MYATELTIGDHAYLLRAGTDERGVLDELTAAVRAGGGVVELPAAAPNSPRSVLISPGVPVFIERIPIPDDHPTPNDGDSEDPCTEWEL